MSPSAPNFSDFIAERTKDFTGREWVFAEIDRWLADSSAQRVFLITGEPGAGKSAIVARLAQMTQGDAAAGSYDNLRKHRPAYIHFCRALKDTTLNPLRFIEALSAALANRYATFRDELLESKYQDIRIINAVQKIETAAAGSNVQNVVIHEIKIGAVPARDAFDLIVRRPLEALDVEGITDTTIVVVDSLDEALTYDPNENIAALLSQVIGDLPPAVRFILTSRNSTTVSQLYGQPRLDLSENPLLNLEDLTHYVRQRLDLSTIPQSIALAERITDASEGNFLYARFALDSLPGDPRLLANANIEAAMPAFPKGLEGLYAEFLRRQFTRRPEEWVEQYKPVLGLLSVARDEGLTREQLCGITGLSTDRLEAVLIRCEQFLDDRSLSGRLTVFHRSLAEYLLHNAQDSLHRISAGERSLAIGESYIDRYSQDWDRCDDYGLRHLVDHLIDAFRYFKSNHQTDQQYKADIRLRQLLEGDKFLIAKASRQGLRVAVEDLRRIHAIWSHDPRQLGVRVRERRLIVRAMLAADKLSNLGDRARPSVEMLIEEAELAGESELLAMLSDLKSGVRLHWIDELVHAPAQTVFETFAGPGANISWISPWLSIARPKSALTDALQPGDEKTGWRVVATNAGHMVRLQKIGTPDLWQQITVTALTDTTSRLRYIRAFPHTALFTLDFFISLVYQMVSRLNVAMINIDFLDAKGRDTLRRVARLAEARTRSVKIEQDALRQNFEGRTLVVSAGLVIAVILALLSLDLTTLAQPLVGLAVLVFVLSMTLNLTWLRKAERIEREFQVTMPGAPTLREMWFYMRVLLALLVFFALLEVVAEHVVR